MPKFSVVISVFNKEGYIAETLQSVLNQTFYDYEIVILNDGSTDGSEKEILKFNDSRIRYLSEENRGASAARNYLIRKAKAPYIALLDADDLWHPEYLSKQNDLIEEFPSENVFAVNSELEIQNKLFKKKYSISLNSGVLVTNFFEASYNASVLTSSTTVMHKSVFENIGYYNIKYLSGEDTDLFIRTGLKYNVVFNPQVLAKIRKLPDSLSNSVSNIEEMASFEEYSKYEKNNLPLKKFLDLNRYSLCIKAILANDKENYRKNLEKIDINNLSKRQKFLLKQDRKTLNVFFKIKRIFQDRGIELSSFKA